MGGYEATVLTRHSGRSAAETRNPCLSLSGTCSGMDSGSARLRRLSGMTVM